MIPQGALYDQQNIPFVPSKRDAWTAQVAKQRKPRYLRTQAECTMAPVV
jgi:hypothetical protein